MRCDVNLQRKTHGAMRCDLINFVWISTECGQNSVHSYGYGSNFMHFRVHGAMRCDLFLHGAMRCDFERQITRDDAMRWICSNHMGRCDAMGFRNSKARGDAMR